LRRSVGAGRSRRHRRPLARGQGRISRREVTLSGDAELEFASGSITTIAANSKLSLTGDEALSTTRAGAREFRPFRAEDRRWRAFAGQRGGGEYRRALTVGADGYVFVDTDRNDGGSALNVDGALTNKGSIALGTNEVSLSSSTSITAKSIVNTGSLIIDGAGAGPP
jgi:hypothetical protein